MRVLKYSLSPVPVHLRRQTVSIDPHLWIIELYCTYIADSLLYCAYANIPKGTCAFTEEPEKMAVTPQSVPVGQLCTVKSSNTLFPKSISCYR